MRHFDQRVQLASIGKASEGFEEAISFLRTVERVDGMREDKIKPNEYGKRNENVTTNLRYQHKEPNSSNPSHRPNPRSYETYPNKTSPKLSQSP